jgi:hypothetical protein
VNTIFNLSALEKLLVCVGYYTYNQYLTRRRHLDTLKHCHRASSHNPKRLKTLQKGVPLPEKVTKSNIVGVTGRQ